MYAQLDFPLNVYAQALYLQEGHVDYLHYGLVEAYENAWELGAFAAQQRATDLLLSHLPPPPCRLLEIGVGLGTTAAKLAEQGYEITAISPDPQQIALAQIRLAGKGQLLCTSFEAFIAPAHSYDVVLLQESAQYLKNLTLFNKAHQLLAENGQLLLADEVSLQRTPADDANSLPFLKYTLAQAQRCGFKLIKQLDWSTRAAPTIDYILRAIETHRTQLLSDLKISDAILAGLLDSLKLYQQKYREGRYGYVLILFEKTHLPRWQLSEITTEDYPAIQTLFETTFNQPLSRPLWQWKYGNGMAIAAWRQGEMVAHYGGVVRELSYFGVPKKGVQIVDVMVSNKERGVLTRKGPYFLVGATFPEYYAGYGAPILLGFGFPTQRAMQTAERLELYAEVGKMVEIRWQTTRGSAFLGSRIRHLVAFEAEKIVNMLWKQMSRDFSQAILGVRDWQHIQHRYLTHPQKQYEMLLISQRFTERPLGIVLLQRSADTCHLLDIIAPVKYFDLIIRQVSRIVGNWGIQTLNLWITENFAKIFTRLQGTVHPLDIRIPHCIWYAGPPTAEVKEKWWLMGGDTDFL